MRPAILLGALTVFQPALWGIPITLPAGITPDPTTGIAMNTATTPTCAGEFIDCTSTAYISSRSIPGSSLEFRRSFAAWNLDLFALGLPTWDLIDGGALPGGSLDVQV